MSNSTYIEMEDDVREDIGECLPSAPKKEKRRVVEVKPEPQEEKVKPDNFKYNIGDIIKISDPDVSLCSPASPDKQYHDNLRVVFRFFDGNHVYIVEAEDGICLITPEQQTELVERSTQPNTPPDNKPDTVNSRLARGADLIREERHRQIEVEGYDTMHDRHHTPQVLCRAAVGYALHEDPSKLVSDAAANLWPWTKDFWKPKDQLRNLVRAGALIAAAIDRLQYEQE